MNRVLREPNPWSYLPGSAPFAFPGDLELLEGYNRTADAQRRYHLDILPEPFLGRPEAEVVLLNLNPGYTPGEERFHHLDEYFRRVTMANLTHEELEYPFYFLDPTKRSPGHLWWQRRLRGLVDLFGNRTVSRHILCLEYFPYHSERFHSATPRVPSQEYTFALLRAAIDRRAAIIMMRAKTAWFDAVPELAGAEVHVLNSTQAVYVSANNCPTGFAAACSRIRKYANH